jgi:hypothetical protein
MPEWRYVLKQAPGSNRGARLAIITRVKGMVKALRRTLELPMIRFNARLSGATFYLGIAVNDASCGDEAPPDYVEELFLRLGMPLSQYERAWWPQRGEDVEQFLQGVSEYDHLTSPLKFERLTAPILPASLTDAEEIEAAQNPEAYDRLHWWCSSKESGTVAQLAELAAALGLSELEGSVWAVLKKLSLLGHLDVFQDQDREWVWRIAPLTVVETATNATAFLAGALSGKLRNQLATKLGAVIDPTNGGPSRVGIPTDRLAELDSIVGFASRRAGAASSRWATLLPGIREYQTILVPDPAIASEPHHYSFKRYSGGGFVPVNGQELPSGFYQVQRNGQQFLPKHVFRTADSRWLNGDFATLRFLSLAVGGQQAKARHYPDGTLIVPMIQRWPSLYERALVLASGQLPSIQSVADRTGRLLAYRTIPKDVAQTLASKLDVTLAS